MPIYIISDNYKHKTDLADLSSFWEKKDFFAANIAISFTLESEYLQLELTKFPVFSLCFDKIPCVLTKFPVFSVTGIFLCHFPCFPCVVGTLNISKNYGQTKYKYCITKTYGKVLSMQANND